MCRYGQESLYGKSKLEKELGYGELGLERMRALVISMGQKGGSGMKQGGMGQNWKEK